MLYKILLVFNILKIMNNATKTLLNIDDTFEDYMKLIKDLGIPCSLTYKKHWTPCYREDENQYKHYIVHYNDRQKLDWHYNDSINFNAQYFKTSNVIKDILLERSERP